MKWANSALVFIWAYAIHLILDLVQPMSSTSKKLNIKEENQSI
jgi:hypothetical protein